MQTSFCLNATHNCLAYFIFFRNTAITCSSIYPFTSPQFLIVFLQWVACLDYPSVRISRGRICKGLLYFCKKDPQLKICKFSTIILRKYVIPWYSVNEHSSPGYHNVCLSIGNSKYFVLSSCLMLRWQRNSRTIFALWIHLVHLVLGKCQNPWRTKWAKFQLCIPMYW